MRLTFTTKSIVELRLISQATWKRLLTESENPKHLRLHVRLKLNIKHLSTNVVRDSQRYLGHTATDSN